MNFESHFHAEFSQRVDVAQPRTPKVEVLPHHDAPHSEPFHEDLAHKFLWHRVRSVGRELDQVHVLNASRLEQFQLLVQRVQQFGGILGPQHQRRVAIECDHCRGHSQTFRLREKLTYDGLMSDVHAVVHPDAGGGLLNAFQAAIVFDDLHRAAR